MKKEHEEKSDEKTYGEAWLGEHIKVFMNNRQDPINVRHWQRGVATSLGHIIGKSCVRLHLVSWCVLGGEEEGARGGWGLQPNLFRRRERCRHGGVGVVEWGVEG